jgi:hypothetical protein
MPALSYEQRPTSSDPGTVICTSILVLAVAIAVVPVVDRAARGVCPEQRVGDFEAVENALVPGRAEAEPRQVDELKAHQGLGGDDVA